MQGRLVFKNYLNSGNSTTKQVNAIVLSCQIEYKYVTKRLFREYP